MVLSKMATVGRSALGAKRALFGPVDHSALKDALAKQRKVLDDINKRRWNFDFAKDTPLNGPYKWTEVTGSSEIPEFYKRSPWPHSAASTCLENAAVSDKVSAAISDRVVVRAVRRRSARLSPKNDPKEEPKLLQLDFPKRRSIRHSPPPPLNNELFGHVTLPTAPPGDGERRTSVCQRRLTVGGGGPVTRRASLCLPPHLTTPQTTVDFKMESRRKRKQTRLPEQLAVVKQEKPFARRQTLGGGHCCELSRHLASVEKENQQPKGSSPNWGKKRRLSSLHTTESPGKRTKTFPRRHSMEVSLRSTPSRALRSK